MRGRLILTIALALMGFGACSGAQSGPAMPPLPDSDTRATLAGPLCEASECQCSDDPAKVGAAPEGYKRFKIELGPTDHELWASVDGNELYKSGERASACFYLDLEVGDHPISLRAKGEAGFGARMQVSELGGKGPWWYPTFDFECGAPGLCDKEGLRRWKSRLAKVDAGKHAPCGSVRILGVDWQTGRMPDNLHPADFFLEANMKVYKFTPSSEPGSAECSKSTGE